MVDTALSLPLRSLETGTVSEIDFLVLPAVATRGRAPLRFSPGLGEGSGSSLHPSLEKVLSFGTLARNSNSELENFSSLICYKTQVWEFLHILAVNLDALKFS